MKKKLLVLTLIIGMIVGFSNNSQAFDPCTRAWAVAYNQISGEYTAALEGCFWDAVLMWISPDIVDAFTNVNCVSSAYGNYSAALDAASGQYEACLGF